MGPTTGKALHASVFSKESAHWIDEQQLKTFQNWNRGGLQLSETDNMTSSPTLSSYCPAMRR